jgi:hypothetical protein
LKSEIRWAKKCEVSHDGTRVAYVSNFFLLYSLNRLDLGLWMMCSTSYRLSTWLLPPLTIKTLQPV